MHIFFGIEKTQFGLLIAGKTEKGLCFVGIGHDEEQLPLEVLESFPAAKIDRNDSQLKKYLEILNDRLSGKVAGEKLLLDIHGTQFQKTVWKFLTTIPSGQTKSYSELATAIGRPRAFRPVGTACGKNPLSLVLPCHRIISKTGKLTGFRWGKDIKKALLDWEQENSSLMPNINWIDKESYN